MTHSHCPYAAVLFDLAGTLLDTAPDFATVLNQLRDEHSLAPLPYHTIRSQVSNGSASLITLGLGLASDHSDFEIKRSALLAKYAQHLAVDTCLFPGIADLLTRLERSQTPWGIITNKPALYAQPLLEQLHLMTRCASLVCPDHVAVRKPDPESLLLACQEIQVSPEHCIYIGDHQRDIQAGLNAGMKTIAATYGYIAENDQPDTWGADWQVTDSRLLADVIFHA